MNENKPKLRHIGLFSFKSSRLSPSNSKKNKQGSPDAEGAKSDNLMDTSNSAAVLSDILMAEVSFVVVVYHVTIVAIGHGLLKKFWPMVIGCVLRTAKSSII